MATISADDWFESAPEVQRRALVVLREMILSVGTGILEEIKWSRPCYSTSRGMFCYLHRTTNHVTIGFQRGGSLGDPNNLLDGTGKEMRHVKIANANAVDRQAILELIRQAFRIP